MAKRVFITRRILSDGPELLRSKGLDVTMRESDTPLSYEDLKKTASQYDALITMLSDQIDASFLLSNPHLKVIANYAVGYNNIDVKTASALKMAIGNTPGVLTEATAEVAMGLMLSTARNFNEAQISAKSGEWKDWQPMGHLGHSLKGKTLGLVGLGRIGGRLAEMAFHAFQMKIIYTARSEKENTFGAKKVGLEELLRMSDFVSLHVPLSTETLSLIAEKELSMMKKSAILINTSRGEVIDQNALVHALKNKIIFGAGLDVTTPEPLPPSHELFSLKNALILPHIGSASFEARKNMSLMSAENVLAGLEGRELKGWVNKKDLHP